MVQWDTSFWSPSTAAASNVTDTPTMLRVRLTFAPFSAATIPKFLACSSFASTGNAFFDDIGRRQGHAKGHLIGELVGDLEVRVRGASFVGEVVGISVLKHGDSSKYIFTTSR